MNRLMKMVKNRINKTANADYVSKNGGVSTGKIHFWWVISVMAMLIIILSSLLYFQVALCEGMIMKLMSFASTLLSIVLSVFAVMYSYYSMQDASRNWGNVSNMLKTIEAYTNNINSFNRQLVDQLIQINRNIGNIQGVNTLNNEIPKNSLKEMTTGNKLSRVLVSRATKVASQKRTHVAVEDGLADEGKSTPQSSQDTLG
jgi:hypothetical protein